MNGPGRVFVYGTLRRGGGAPPRIRRLLEDGAERVGEGIVRGRLLDAGAFPAAVPAGERVIRGEVLRLTRPEAVLPVLDRYEGHVGDGPFRREVVRVEMDEGGSLAAWAYIFTGDERGLPEIPSGDWLRQRPERQPAASRGAESPHPAGRETMPLQLHSEAFDDGERIPDRHTCEGDDVSPPLAWEGVPEEAESVALVVDDPDAPGTVWVHWVVYGLGPQRDALPEGVAPDEELGDGLQGVNDFGDSGWGGPCPPPGDGEHRYRFHLYALDVEPALGPGATKEDVLEAAEGHVLADALLTGTYSR